VRRPEKGFPIMANTAPAPRTWLQRVGTASLYVPFLLMHVLALGVVFFRPTVGLVAACFALYAIRMWAVTAGYHRYFSHRSYKTSRFFQFVLAFLAQTSAQKGALWWAAHHRDHHRYSDQPEDVHSPVRDGFWWSHVGWILDMNNDATKLENVKDLARYPELVWLNRYHVVPAAIVGVGMFLVGGWPLLFWGFFLSTVLCWHGTFIINSLCHVFGSRRYQTTDTSRNNLLFALITLGEGWHNNHHHYQSSTRQGFFWWEIDITYYVLKTLSWMGIVWDLRQPPESAKYAHLGERKPVRKAPAMTPSLELPEATA
jgi:stearoyl-CoA desaturase (delta-9 desaturase)